MKRDTNDPPDTRSRLITIGTPFILRVVHCGALRPVSRILTSFATVFVGEQGVTGSLRTSSRFDDEVGRGCGDADPAGSFYHIELICLYGARCQAASDLGTLPADPPTLLQVLQVHIRIDI